MRLTIYLLLTLFSIFNVNGQGTYKYKEVPLSLIENFRFSINSKYLNELSVGSIDLTSYLPKGYNKGGKIDYTRFLQKGLDENRVVLMPNFPILINAIGLKIKSNSKIIFLEHSTLIISSNKNPRYHGLLLSNVQNVEIYQPRIIGDKYKHLSKEGQWGMGVWIKHSKNISIYGAEISKCWGDGIYIGNENGIASENILIDHAFLDDNRRNGISITSGKNISIRNVLASNTNGQNPRSGIDIEPNTKNDVLERIQLKNITTYNNAMHGIIISVGSLGNNYRKSIDIDIENHTDFYSTIGLGISTSRMSKSVTNYPLRGRIIVANGNFNNNSHASIKNYLSKPNNIDIIFIKTRVNNLDRQAETSKLKSSFNKGIETKIK